MISLDVAFRMFFHQAVYLATERKPNVHFYVVVQEVEAEYRRRVGCVTLGTKAITEHLKPMLDVGLYSKQLGLSEWIIAPEASFTSAEARAQIDPLQRPLLKVDAKRAPRFPLSMRSEFNNSAGQRPTYTIVWVSTTDLRRLHFECNACYFEFETRGRKPESCKLLALDTMVYCPECDFYGGHTAGCEFTGCGETKGNPMKYMDW
jgi:hypothetical protein